MKRKVIRHIWERKILEGEGILAHDLFNQYRDLGSQRSHAKLAEVTGRSVQLISKVSAKYKWRKRATAYDQHMILVRQRAIERAEADIAVKRALRKMKHQEDEYQLGERLKAKIFQMLELPLYEDEVQEITEVAGQQVVTKIIRTPGRWTLRDVPSWIESMSKMLRLSLEMETSRETLNVNVDDPEKRKLQARAALDKLFQRVDSYVSMMLAADPSLDPVETKKFVVSQLPKWCEEDFEVPIEDLHAEEAEDYTMPYPGALQLGDGSESETVN